MALLFGFVAAGTVTNLFPTVVATLGYSDVISLLLTVPPYVLAVITSFCNAWHADRTGERYFHITVPLYFAVIAFIIAATTTSIGPRYFAMMLMPAGVYTGYVVALGWISNTLPRPPAKVVSLFRQPRGLADAWLARRSPSCYQRCLELLVYLRIIHVPRGCRTALQWVLPIPSKLKANADIISCRHERELCDGLPGHLYGYFASVYSRQSQQKAWPWRASQGRCGSGWRGARRGSAEGVQVCFVAVWGSSTSLQLLSKWLMAYLSVFFSCKLFPQCFLLLAPTSITSASYPTPREDLRRYSFLSSTPTNRPIVKFCDPSSLLYCRLYCCYLVALSEIAFGLRTLQWLEYMRGTSALIPS